MTVVKTAVNFEHKAMWRQKYDLQRRRMTAGIKMMAAGRKIEGTSDVF